MRPDLSFVPVDEHRVDGDETEPPAHAQRRKQRSLAQAGDRNVERAADFQQTGFLKVADDEGVVSGPLGFQRVTDRLRGAAPATPAR